MKNSIMTFAFFFLGIYAKGQSIDKLLYHAVKTKDTIQVELLLDKGADANYKEQLDVSEFKTSILILSVLNEDFKTLKLLVDHKAEVDWRDWFKATALMYAAGKGNLPIIKYLLQNGADIHAKDGNGGTVLSAAKEGNHPETIKFIEDNL